jgi:hypothetical protein
MQFFVKDGATGLGIDSAKVTVRKDSDNSLVQSATTDANGMVDLTLVAGVSYVILAYKTGEYDGARISVINNAGAALPGSVSLLKVTQRVMKLQVFQGTFATPLSGARVEIKNGTGGSVLVQTTGSDGKYQANLQADLTGWTVNVTYPGLDGVIVPLEKIDLLGTLDIVLAPLIGSDE